MKKNGPVDVLFASFVLCCLGTACSPGPVGENQSFSSAAAVVLPAQAEDPTSEEPSEQEMDMELMADKRNKRELTKDGSMYVRSETVNRPLVRFPDGQVSSSDSCAVRTENKLNRAVPPAYVNGQPVGFC
jgi:hypothetical protein